VNAVIAAHPVPDAPERLARQVRFLVEVLWEYAARMIAEAVARGHLAPG
jgi:hypothetical protein